jgi:hypothetical protein
LLWIIWPKEGPAQVTRARAALAIPVETATKARKEMMQVWAAVAVRVEMAEMAELAAPATAAAVLAATLMAAEFMPREFRAFSTAPFQETLP